MRITRRKLIGSTVRVGLGFGLSRPLWACGEAPVAPPPSPEKALLTFPPELTDGSLSAARASQVIRPGLSAELWTLGRTYPSPTIRRRRGDTFELELTNELGEDTNIHWHGLSVPADMDGHPRDSVADGQARVYRFPIAQRAGTYWYHPHPHERTAKQVYLGMAGFFIVGDEEEDQIDLPRGELDVPLLLQDRRLTTGAIEYVPTMGDVANGYLGETLFVNGVPSARLEVASTLYRFRALNGSNARTFKLAFADGRSMHLIGTDGGLIDAPVATNELWLAPAERADLLVDFSSDPIGTSVKWMSESFAVGDAGAGHGGHGSAGTLVRQGARLELLQIDVARAGPPRTVPTSLAQLERLDPTAALRTRTFELIPREGVTSGMHVINGQVFALDRIDEEVPFGELEIWRVESKDSVSIHPMHLHGAQFRVVSRSGLALPSDRGWKDTVLVFPNETVELAVRFTDYRGAYLFHCHTLEHEDDGMMLNVNVT